MHNIACKKAWGLNKTNDDKMNVTNEDHVLDE